MKNLGRILGKELESKLTGLCYGVRECGTRLPEGFSDSKFGAPIAEDDSGNIVTVLPGGSVSFWDHETDQLTVIASSWDEFASGWVAPKPVNFEPGQVKSGWIDPDFAKSIGIPVPKDGWIRKHS
jgi:hypothetical protein